MVNLNSGDILLSETKLEKVIIEENIRSYKQKITGDINDITTLINYWIKRISIVMAKMRGEENEYK